jgi:hypothetical protein
MDIEAMHPLRSKAKFEHIVPIFQCFRRCIKRKLDYRQSLRITLLKEMKIKLPKGEAEIIKDPFLLLGYGINAYFDIMMSLAMMCACITLMMAPVFKLYSSNDVHGLKSYDKYGIN